MVSLFSTTPYSPQTTSVVPPSATRLDIHFYPSEKKAKFHKKKIVTFYDIHTII